MSVEIEETEGWEATSIIRDTLLAVTTDQFVSGPTYTPVGAPVDGGRPIADVLDGRHAGRTYGPRPVELDLLDRLAGSALHHDRNIFADQDVSISIRGVVWRADQQSGEYHLGEDTIRRVGDIAGPEAGPRFLLQREFAEAAAVLLVEGDMAAALARDGDHGYRRLISRGAAAAHHLWLDAEANGLECCAFAGVLGDEELGIVRPSSFRNRILIAAAVGYPPAAR